MGHLVNPNALRMGWSSNWMDVFFVDQKYYPQYLHMLFRLRLLLPLIFHQYWFERKGAFFCSHFEFTKDYNGLLLKLFFYDGRTEDFFHDIANYIREDKRDHFQNLTPQNWHQRKSRSFFIFYVFFVFFRLFHPFYPTLQWPYALQEHPSIEAIARAFFLFDKRPMFSSLALYPTASRSWRRRASVKVSSLIPFRFFYFYLMCRNLALFTDREHPAQGAKPGEFLHLFTFVYCILLRNHFIFQTLSPYLLFLLNFFTKTYKNPTLEFVQVSFLAITNENITAAFIARFIALKLRQGFTAWGLLKPLRREFTRLLHPDLLERKSFRLPFEFLLRRQAHKDYFSSLFRTILKKLAYFFQKQSYSFFLCWKTKLNFDSFLFLDSLCHRTHFSLKTQSSSRISFRLKRYFAYYFYFCLFNYNRFPLYHQWFINHLFTNILKLQSDLHFGEKIPLFFFPQMVPRLLSNNFENYSSWEPAFGGFYKTSLLQLFLLSFRKKMHQLYSEQSHFYLAKAALSKNRLLRLYNPKTSMERRVGFRGFKIQCLGRFTRRQRSAKLTWIGHGVPLNTISAFIDYGSFQTVLLNSSINVRVWFYKDRGFQTYYVKVL